MLAGEASQWEQAAEPKGYSEDGLDTRKSQRVHSQRKQPDDSRGQFPLPTREYTGGHAISAKHSGHTILPTLPTPAAFLPLEQGLPSFEAVPPARLAMSVAERDALRSLFTRTVGNFRTWSRTCFGCRRMVIEGNGQRDTGSSQNSACCHRGGILRDIEVLERSCSLFRPSRYGSGLLCCEGAWRGSLQSRMNGHRRGSCPVRTSVWKIYVMYQGKTDPSCWAR